MFEFLWKSCGQFGGNFWSNGQKGGHLEQISSIFEGKWPGYLCNAEFHVEKFMSDVIFIPNTVLQSTMGLELPAFGRQSLLAITVTPLALHLSIINVELCLFQETKVLPLKLSLNHQECTSPCCLQCPCTRLHSHIPARVNKLRSQSSKKSGSQHYCCLLIQMEQYRVS